MKRSITHLGLVAGIVLLSFAFAACGGGGTISGAGQSAGQFNTIPTATSPSPTLYVSDAEFNSINSYPANATGNVAPTGTLKGPQTGLSDSVSLASDPAGNIVALNIIGRNFPQPARVTVYPSTATGDAAPTRTIAGDKTFLSDGAMGLAVDSLGRTYVFDSLSTCTGTLGAAVVIYGANATGNVAPVASIPSTSTTKLFDVSGFGDIAVDRSDKIYTLGTDSSGNGEVNIYDAGKFGDVAPLSTITNISTPDRAVGGIAVDSSGKIYVAVERGTAELSGSVFVFAPGASGNAAPVQTISGPDTGLLYSIDVAVDSNGEIYVANDLGGGLSGKISVFAPGANGDAAPIRTISGDMTGLVFPRSLLVR